MASSLNAILAILMRFILRSIVGAALSFLTVIAI
jgi:hypothetical protein